jgi:hypothetical protein
MKILGISHVEGVKAMSERPLGLGNANKMDVIAHQAVSPNFDGIAVFAFPKPGEVTPEIGILFENILLVVSPLGDLVGIIDDGGAG